jgi:hypothetical protein
MPDLAQSLSKTDSGFQRIIAQFWDLDFPDPMEKNAAKLLAELMLKPDRVKKVWDGLPQDAKNALQELIDHNGKHPYIPFARKYGEIRRVGLARREREQLHLTPISTLEVLYYRGLVFTAFLELAGKIEEVIYIPSDLLALMPLNPSRHKETALTPAHPEDYAQQLSCHDHIIDDACTFLSWLRKSPNHFTDFSPIEPFLILNSFHYPTYPYPYFLYQILLAAKLFYPDHSPNLDAIRDFLAEPRSQALTRIYQSWLQTERINELKQLPDITCLGDWQNDPLATRHFLIRQLLSVNEQKWFSIDEFIRDIYQTEPDFQRPSSNYDVWLIQDRSSGRELRGFESWPNVEGRLLRAMIAGPLFWLGIVDLGQNKNRHTVTFKRTPWSESLLNGNIPAKGFRSENENIKIQSNGRIIVPIYCPRNVRYHIARSSSWEGYHKGKYHFRINASSLEEAQRQGLKPKQLMAMLRKHTDFLPPSLFKAVVRWEESIYRIKLQKLSVLTVSSPEILDQIKKSRLARHILNTLNSTTIAILPGSEELMERGLLELGYLVEGDVNTFTSASKITPKPSPADAENDEQL